MSWFDDYEKSQSEKEETQEYPATILDDHHETEHETKSSRRVPLVVGIALIVGVFGASVAGIISWNQGGSKETENIAASTTSSASPSSSQPPTSFQTPASSSTVQPVRCPKEPKSGNGKPEETVVAFQHAYFAGDTAALSKTIDSASYLANVDWVTAAGDLIGSHVCVVVVDVNDQGIVTADTTLRTSKGEELLLLQKYTTVKKGNAWVITAVEDRLSL